MRTHGGTRRDDAHPGYLSRVAGTQGGPDLHPATRELAGGPDHAAIGSLLPDGRIRTRYIRVGVEATGSTCRPSRTGRSSRTSSAAPGSPPPSGTGRPDRYAEGRGRVADTERGQSARDQIDHVDMPLTPGRVWQAVRRS